MEAPATLPDVAADAPAPLQNVTTLAGEVSAARRSDGHFVFNVTVNGRPAAMLLDTGASVVTIRAEEAARLGLPMGRLKYTIKVSTANGVAMMAAVKIDTLTVGAITQHGVAAFVASPGTLNDDLLGQSFLRNLRQVTVENDHAILRGK